MRYEMTTWNGEPAIRVQLNYDEMREYLALDEEWIEVLDSLTASERRAATLELYLVPLREVAEYAVGTAGKPTDRLPALTAATTAWAEDDYHESLYSLEGIDRAAYLHVLDRAARIIAAGDPGLGYRGYIPTDGAARETGRDRRPGRSGSGVLCAGGVAPLRPDSGGVDTAYPCLGPLTNRGWPWWDRGLMRWRAVEEVRARVRSTPAA